MLNYGNRITQNEVYCCSFVSTNSTAAKNLKEKNNSRENEGSMDK